MNWIFYRNRLLYILPFYLIISVFTYILIGGAIDRSQHVNTEVANIFQTIVVVELIILWFITPFTFMFLESFKITKTLFTYELKPDINYPADTPDLIKIIITTIAFILSAFLSLIKYVLSCNAVILLNFIISPIAILVLILEKVIKWLRFRKNTGN